MVALWSTTSPTICHTMIYHITFNGEPITGCTSTYVPWKISITYSDPEPVFELETRWPRKPFFSADPRDREHESWRPVRTRSQAFRLRSPHIQIRHVRHPKIQAT